MPTLIETAGNQLATAGSSITVTTSGSPAAGEKLIAVVYHTDDYTNTPSGWTQDAEYASTGVVNVFSKTATGSEGISFVFTAPSPGSMAARVMRYSGLGAVHSVYAGSSYATGTLTSGNVETSVADVFLVAAGALRSATLPLTDITPSSGYTKVATDLKATNSGAKAMLQVATRTVATAGTYNYVGTHTVETTTTGEATGVGYLQVTGDAGLTAVRATATATARVPAVTGGSSSGSVTAVRATATATAPEPAIDISITLTGGGAATATAMAPAPVVLGSGSVNVAAVRATATALAGVPTVVGLSNNGLVTAVRATATATARTPGVGTNMTMPSNTGYGIVKARFASSVLATPDADGFANLVPQTGTVTFTPTAAVLLNATASPDPLIITPKTITCTVDSQGYLLGAKTGERFVNLLATDDPDVVPVGWKWRVTCNIVGAVIQTFDLAVPEGTTIDLVTKIPT